MKIMMMVEYTESAWLDGGEGGIRTHGRVSPTLAFEASSFNRSDTSPPRCGSPSLANAQSPHNVASWETRETY
jgi:hypothetical protein